MLIPADQIVFPRRGRGRLSAAAQADYDATLQAFCAAILQIRSRLDFEVSARGWGYLLEQWGAITKADLDRAETLINDCRKSGALPLDICAVDEKRAFDNLEQIDATTPEEEAADIIERARQGHLYYHPVSFWEFQPVYIEMVVEKIDLKSLFRHLTEEFHIPCANGGGWSDINMRAAMMRRFQYWEKRGKRLVLLYCGDFDPAGLLISDHLKSNMIDLKEAVGWSPDSVHIDRFGLNREFIDQHNLTWIDNLITGSGKDLADPKHPDHFQPYVRNYIREHGTQKVEANALVAQPEAGRDLCRSAILRYIDPDGVAEFHRVTQERRALVAAEVARLMREHE